jgi:hypothetical protein
MLWWADEAVRTQGERFCEDVSLENVNSNTKIIRNETAGGNGMWFV